MIYYIAYWVVFVVFRVVYPHSVIDRDKYMPDKKVILCGNHTQLTDSVLVALALSPRYRPRFIAKHQLFKNKLVAWFLRQCGAYPVNRDTADLEAIKTTLKILKEDGTLILFPEGTRVSEEETSAAKAGAGMFAYKTGATVIPVYLSPKKRPFKRFYIRFGAPVPIPELNHKPTVQDYTDFSNTIMAHVFALGDS